MSGATAVPLATWWEQSLAETGVQGMEKLLAQDASWDEVVALGREDLRRGLEFTKLTPGRDQTVIDIGCGIGRMSQALAEHFGHVIGVDISETLLEAARKHNQRDNITFARIDGTGLQGLAIDPVDVVFSYEVLYLLPPEIVEQYIRDAFAILKPNGQLVFQLNLNPMTWKTRVARPIRTALHLCGVKSWRGWPTTPDLRRYSYDQKMVCRMLSKAGFRVARVAGDSIRQTWFVGRKPESAV